MNPHAAQPTSPLDLINSVWQNRNLIVQMTKREVVGRYKGSIMGLGWSFFNPILMLVIYTFVFSVVFKARWGVGDGGSKTEFAIILFVGLIIHSLFAETVNAAPKLILSNINYVKKVIFPLEILPVITLGASLCHGLISFSVLLAAFVLLNGFMYWTALLLPLVLLPLLFVTLGFSWFLASLGVYLRDVGQIIVTLTIVMLFLAPILYPVSALPQEYQVFLYINPLTFIIEQTRDVLIFGKLPEWEGLAIYGMASFVFAWGGYWWFQSSRKGFSDVL